MGVNLRDSLASFLVLRDKSNFNVKAVPRGHVLGPLFQVKFNYTASVEREDFPLDDFTPPSI